MSRIYKFEIIMDILAIIKVHLFPENIFLDFLMFDALMKILTRSQCGSWADVGWVCPG